MTVAANNKQNVSTTRGVRGGYFLSAPLGTTDVPTKNNFTTWTPGSDWENQGYIVEDGVTESASSDGGDALRDINLDQVDTAAGTHTETLQVGLMENAYAPLATIFGHANVSDSAGVLETKHRWSEADETRMYVLLLLLKNGRKWVKFIPAAKVSSVDDLTLNATTVAQRGVTLTYLTDDSGTGCYDWMESTETPAPQLTALSGTNLTLSPTFSATVRSYTATASSTTTTLTATAGAGNTVSIKDANGNTYSSGGSIPIVTGTNKITVTVTTTATGAVGVYTITATKS